MDPIIGELLKYGWQGVIIAVVLLLVKVLGPSLSTWLPAWATAQARREDQLMAALRTATAVMAEMVAVLQSLRSEIGAIRQDQTALRGDVERIVEQLAQRRGGSRQAAGGSK